MAALGGYLTAEYRRRFDRIDRLEGGLRDYLFVWSKEASGMTSPTTEGPAAGLRAVILAGGKGTRLRPFTVSFPKPLVPLGDTPVLEVLLRRLRRFGIQDITLTLGHLAELVKAYFHHRRSAVEGLTLRYVEEEEPTGTAGSLAFVTGLDRTFLAMNGDLLTNLDFHALVRFHREQGVLLTIATHSRRTRTNLGSWTSTRLSRSPVTWRSRSVPIT